MNLARIFANAVARRVAYVVVAAALAWLGLSDARAQDYSLCNVPTANFALCPDKPAAIAAARASALHYCEQMAGCQGVKSVQENWTGSAWEVRALYRYGSESYGGYGMYKRALLTCASGRVYNTFTESCQQPCTGRPSTVQTFLPLSGSKQCYNGCVVSYMQNGDDETSTRSYSGAMCGNDQFKQDCGAGFFWNGYMSVCQPIEPDCPAGQVREGGVCKPENQCPDGMIAVTGSTPGAIASGSLNCKPSEDTCPAGQIRSPSGQCLPGEGQCAAGEARRKDGTCGKDDNGDGVADDDDDDDNNDSQKESFSGGDSCTAPPSCAGGPIDCGMARIQWRIDCNTRTKVNITGGTCGAVPQCVGENCRAMEYAQLLQQWRSACALEKLSKGEGGEGGAVGDANKNGVADVLEGNLTPSTGGDGDTETGVSVKSVGTSLLNTDNIFGAGSCPQPPTFQIMGTTVSGADFPHWCNAMLILRGCILIFGAFTAIKILMGWGF
ncbi:MAG: hypothetical protein NVV67_16580 [Pseudoxanthomonas sp.]|nr:hypothetical protein [Pseudoxanthomonas sp.]